MRSKSHMRICALFTFRESLLKSLKMTFLTILVLLGLVAITAVVVWELRDTSEEMIAQQEAVIREDYDKSIKEQVQNAISLLEKVDSMIQEGQLTQKEGKKLAADLLRELRYGDHSPHKRRRR